EKMILEVIDTITLQNCDVQDSQGKTYSLTVRPYKSMDNRIDGAVLMLYDIDEIRRHQQEAQEAREYAEAIFNAARDPMVVLNAKLRVDRVNRAFTALFEKANGDVAGRSLPEIFGGLWNEAELHRLLNEVIPRD